MQEHWNSQQGEMDCFALEISSFRDGGLAEDFPGSTPLKSLVPASPWANPPLPISSAAVTTRNISTE